MAKVTGPLHSSEARGAVGSLTYNSWRGIATVKARSGPSVTGSTAQLATRARTKTITLSWQGLTDAQRAKWNHYADQNPDIDWTGTPKRLSGYNHYVRVNWLRVQAGASVSATLPTELPEANVTVTHIADGPGLLTVFWTPTSYPTTALAKVDVWATAPLSAAVNPNIQDAHRKFTYTLSAGNYYYSEASSGWVTIFYRVLLVNGRYTPFKRFRGHYTPIPP